MLGTHLFFPFTCRTDIHPNMLDTQTYFAVLSGIITILSAVFFLRIQIFMRIAGSFLQLPTLAILGSYLDSRNAQEFEAMHDMETRRARDYVMRDVLPLYPFFGDVNLSTLVLLARFSNAALGSKGPFLADCSDFRQLSNLFVLIC